MPKTRQHYGQASLPPKQPEINSGEYLLEEDGYLPLEHQLLRLQAAGQRLRQFRVEAFDFANGEVEDGYEDPTRRPNFDMADASEILADIERRYNLRMAERAQDDAPDQPLPQETEPEPTPDEPAAPEKELGDTLSPSYIDNK